MGYVPASIMYEFNIPKLLVLYICHFQVWAQAFGAYYTLAHICRAFSCLIVFLMFACLLSGLTGSQDFGIN